MSIIAETFPLEPLYELARRHSGAGDKFTNKAFARMVRHTPKATARWRETGVPWLAADRAAVSLGVLPFAVWGFEWIDIKGDHMGAYEIECTRRAEKQAKHDEVWLSELDEDGLLFRLELPQDDPRHINEDTFLTILNKDVVFA